MEGILNVPDKLHVSEVLHQHLELSHYIDTYRQATERVRWVIFVLMVLCVVVLVAQWNTAPASWLRHRLDKLVEIDEAVAKSPSGTANATVARLTKGRFQSLKELEASLDQYRSAVFERVVLFEIPGIGVTFDINDLGLFSGVAFSLLLLLLVFALMREYENLYLALFKVRRLHDSNVTLAGAESAANYLYHALAMSQVFAAPPTLAVWRPSALKRSVPSIVFLLPALIQSYIIYTNYNSLDRAIAYGLTKSVMVPQYALLGFVITLAAIAIAYAKACDHRWRSAFLHVNPSFKRVGHVPWSVWLRLPFRAQSFGDHLQRVLSGQLVQRLRVTRDRYNGVIEVEEKDFHVPHGLITYHQLRDMGRLLRKKAEKKAQDACSEYQLLRVNVKSSVLHENAWSVVARYDIRCKFKDQSVEEENAD